MGGIASGINGLLGLGGDIYGGILSQQAMDWLRGAYVNNLNFGRQGYGDWTQRYNANTDPARDQALNFGGQFGGALGGALGPYMDAAAGLGGQVPGLVGQYGGPFSSAQTDTASGGLASILGGAGDIFGSGGWTPQNYRLFDQGQDFAQGNTDPQRAFSNIGQYLLNSGGRTDFNQGTQERAMDSVNVGGMTQLLGDAQRGAQLVQSTDGATAQTQDGVEQAMQLLQGLGQTPNTQLLGAGGLQSLIGNLGVAGLTTTGARGELAALSGIEGQGRTALSSALQQKALEILKTNPTLSLEDAVSMARDAAATAANQQGRTARSRALARGGGPGSIVASGSQNEAMTDFADQAMQAEAGAGRDALIKQQGVLTDQQKLAASLGLGAGGLEQGTLGTYADLLKGLEGVAASRFGTGGNMLGQGTALETDRLNTGFSGLTNLSKLESDRLLSSLGLLPTIQNSATNNLSTFGNLGLGAAGDQNARLKTGTDMLSQWLSSAMGGSKLSADANTSAQGYALGAGGLGSTAATNLGQLGLGQGQLGQNNFQNIFNALNQGVTQQGNANNTAIQGQQNLSTNPLLTLGGQSSNILGMFGGAGSGLQNLPSGSNAFSGSTPNLRGFN
jgi:hypothetical protein